MSKVGPQRAAEMTGRSKSTIQRAMNTGKLSYEIDQLGRRVIDVSELERVFGLAPEGAEPMDVSQAVKAELQRAAEMLEAERLKMRIRILEDQLHTAEEQLDDMKSQRDQWQKQAQQVLLTSQYSQKQAEELKAEIKERDAREAARRQALEERMKKLKEQSQNQNQPANGGGNVGDKAGFWGRLIAGLKKVA
jgi:chromosome segregation ATPase